MIYEQKHIKINKYNPPPPIGCTLVFDVAYTLEFSSFFPMHFLNMFFTKHELSTDPKSELKGPYRNKIFFRNGFILPQKVAIYKRNFSKSLFLPLF